ncbi:MAG: glycerophosphodiester phosphodiesterase family protein [Balneolaceae bacterium]|nr:glycerophosphodiester phosphodiesterase family protein [Balneolaceae bacterium]
MLPNLYNDDGDGFIVIAHRGASAYYPENTMSAFRGAVEMDAEMIELDVMMSSDGIPVVFHDAQLNEHTNGSGSVADYTLKQLKQFDAGGWFDSKFSDQRIPTLEEVLKFAQGKIALNIEIKTESVTDGLYGGVEEKSIDLVEKYDMEKHVLFSSFDYRAVRHIKRLDSNIPAALLYEKNQSGNMLPSELVSTYNADAFNCSYQQLTRKRLRDILSHDIPVFVYTVNEKRRMRRLINKGVAGIFTDKPDLLNKVVKEVKSRKLENEG